MKIRLPDLKIRPWLSLSHKRTAQDPRLHVPSELRVLQFAAQLRMCARADWKTSIKRSI